MLNRLLCIALLSLLAILATGCATPSIPKDLPHAAGNPLEPASAANTSRVVFINEMPEIYNGDRNNPLYRPGVLMRDMGAGMGLGKVNVTINGKGFSQIPLGQFSQVMLPYGEHEVHLTHRDVVDFNSTKKLVVDKPAMRVLIYPGPFGHIFRVVDPNTPLTALKETE